jgi:hypothetical protein
MTALKLSMEQHYTADRAVEVSWQGYLEIARNLS